MNQCSWTTCGLCDSLFCGPTPCPTSVLLSFLWLPQIPVWTTHLVCLLILDGRVGCFLLLTAVSRAAVTGHLFESPFSVLLGVYPGMELPGCVVILGVCLRDTSVCFPQRLHLYTLSPATQEGSGFSTAASSTALSFPFLLNTGAVSLGALELGTLFTLMGPLCKPAFSLILASQGHSRLYIFNILPLIPRNMKLHHSTHTPSPALHPSRPLTPLDSSLRSTGLSLGRLSNKFPLTNQVSPGPWLPRLAVSRRIL